MSVVDSPYIYVQDGSAQHFVQGAGLIRQDGKKEKYTLTLLEPHSHIWGTIHSLNISSLSPKRDRGPKRGNTRAPPADPEPPKGQRVRVRVGSGLGWGLGFGLGIGLGLGLGSG